MNLLRFAEQTERISASHLELIGLYNRYGLRCMWRRIWILRTTGTKIGLQKFNEVFESSKFILINTWFYLKVVHYVPFAPLIAPTECTVLMNAVLQEHLQHVSTQVCHLQGGQNASFPKNMPLEICYLWGSSVCSSLFVDVIKYGRYNSIGWFSLYLTVASCVFVSCRFCFNVYILRGVDWLVCCADRVETDRCIGFK